MDVRYQYVPLAWMNSGYIGSVHSALDLLSPIATPPPPYMEKDPSQSDIHPALRQQASRKQIIYATIQPSKPRISTVTSEPSPPASPRPSISSDDGQTISSTTSDASSISNLDLAKGPNTFSPRPLRRSRKRPRGLSLRDLRCKQSEADLQRVCSATVEEYLTGDIFDNFRVWPEAVIIEET